MLAGLLGLPALTNTLNELSYGGALGTGSGMTWKPKADTVDALMTVSPLAMAAPGAINKGAAFVGKRLEPSVNALVNRTMAKGGLPADLLEGMATNTKSNIFIGKNAKTWDSAAEAKALEMEKAGKDARTIWKETGTLKGADGHWRQEIPDNAASLTAHGKSIFTPGVIDSSKLSGSASIGDIYSHPLMQDAYPRTKWIDVKATPQLEGASYYSIESPFLKNGDRAQFIKLSQSGSNPESSIAHELQHSVQDVEGFARGGSPEQFRGDVPYEDLVGRVNRQQDAYLRAKASGGIDPDTGLSQSMIGEHIDNMIAKINNWKSPEEQYRLLAGEAEARATQARLPMDAAQRRATFPYDSYDVPVDQLIVRGGDGPQMSMPKPFVYPQDAALATAQRNAALPVEQGGLGLKPDNTPMDRAMAMGFDRDMLHGTKNPNIKAFSKDKSNDSLTWITDSPEVSNQFATDAKGSPTTMLLNAQMRKPAGWKDYDNLTIDEFKPRGFDSAWLPDGNESTGFVLEPNQLRSRFAAFDPMRRNSPDLLAGLLPLGFLQEEETRKKLGLSGIR